MADGAKRAQRDFHFPCPTAGSSLRPGEIVVDLFAGGGGASEALRQALGRDPDIAINHDEWAIGMHSANHPFTQHLTEDVWHAEPRRLVGARNVGWLHASPDCTHFSQAKGGQPRARATRSLSWVVLKWAGTVAPRIISLENVEQILKWGPLVAKRDPASGRILTLDLIQDRQTGRLTHRVAERGEHVPIDNQFLVPDKRHAGRTWDRFVACLRALGYRVEWRKLRACDYGAGTSRTRLFMIARRDGEPIQWPAPTHGPGLTPFVTAADCINWSIPTRTIFDRPKPLADATMRRIARGIKRFVIDAAEPFIVPFTQNSRPRSTDDPLGTVMPGATKFAVVAPTLVQTAHGEGFGPTKRRGGGATAVESPIGTIDKTGNSVGVSAAMLVPRYGEREGQEPRSLDVDEPMPTIVPTANGGSVAVAYLEQANGGFYQGAGSDLRKPQPTICSKGTQHRLVTAHLMHASTSNTNGGRGRPDLPLRTILAGGEHNSVVECTLSEEHEAGALRVAAFLINYYGNGVALDLRDPLDTITTKDRLALVTVTIRGTPYVIVDIGLRMLQKEELFRAQGFPTDYIIDRTADGRPITGTRAVRMVGNSVSPPPLRALAAANLDQPEVERRAA